MECHNNHLYICSLDIVISVVMNTPVPLHFYVIFSPLKAKQMAFIVKLWSGVTCCTSLQFVFTPSLCSMYMANLPRSMLYFFF